MQAVVTTTQLTMGQNELDFGHCTIHEKVITKLAITNHSLLPQEYGFVNLPPVSISLIFITVYCR